jgi:hypothetical protein
MELNIVNARQGAQINRDTVYSIVNRSTVPAFRDGQFQFVTDDAAAAEHGAQIGGIRSSDRKAAAPNKFNVPDEYVGKIRQFETDFSQRSPGICAGSDRTEEHSCEQRDSGFH